MPAPTDSAVAGSGVGGAVASSPVHRVEALAARVAYRIVNGLLAAMATLLWPRPRPRAADRVAVYRIGHVGDTACALPAIRAVRRAYPNAHLTLVTSTGATESPGARELLAGADWVDEVLSYRPADIATLARLWRFAMQLRERRFDAWLNLSVDNTSPWRELRDMAFARLVGPRWARGWTVGTLRFVLQAQSELLPFSNETERLLGIVERAGIAPGPVEFALPRVPAVVARLDALLPQAGPRGWVALAPGAKRSTNRWIPGRFAEVGASLAGRGHSIVVLGGKADADECAAIARAIGPGAHSLAGALSLPESCEALRRCRLAVCVDSGVGHLAAAVGTPCLSLFSFRDLRGKWHPHGAANVVLQQWVPCHTCLVDSCPNGQRCMAAIEVRDVVLHAERSLAS